MNWLDVTLTPDIQQRFQLDITLNLKRIGLLSLYFPRGFYRPGNKQFFYLSRELG